MKLRPIGPGMVQQIQQRCSRCGGAGYACPPADKCGHCDGKGLAPEKKVFEVHIEPGHRHGSKVLFRGEAGADSPDVLPGDLIFILEQVGGAGVCVGGGVGAWGVGAWGGGWSRKMGVLVAGLRLASKAGSLPSTASSEGSWLAGRSMVRARVPAAGRGGAPRCSLAPALPALPVTNSAPPPLTLTPASHYPPALLPFCPLPQKEHSTFKRIGTDLFYEKSISLVEALCGTRFHLAHLDDRSLEVSSSGVIKPDSWACIRVSLRAGACAQAGGWGAACAGVVVGKRSLQSPS